MYLCVYMYVCYTGFILAAILLNILLLMSHILIAIPTEEGAYCRLQFMRAEGLPESSRTVVFKL